MEEQVIVTRQLTKNYGQVVALQPINLTISKGDIFGLVGRNGAGKSTLLKIITGQALATDGELMIFNQTGEEALRERRRIGAIIENPSFYPKLTGRKNLEYYRRQRGIPDKIIVNKVLTQLHLESYADRKFEDYSLGNKQRLGLALALMQQPDLLILDEPINGLDPMGIIEFRELLVQLNRVHEITIIISSHLLAELEMLITKVGFIEQGELLSVKTMAELHQECQDYIEIVVDQPEKAVAVLEKELEIYNYSVLTDGKVHLFNNNDKLSQISYALNANKINLMKLEIHQSSLEEYFTNLVGGKTHA